jgi:outer membrane lipoprotein-sorting protein
LKLKFLSLILVFYIIFPGFCRAEDMQARKLLDNLYFVKQGGPIKDMVIELEDYTPISRGEGSSSVMQIYSKDKVLFKTPNKLRVDMVIMDPNDPMTGRQITIFRDGVNHWMYVSTGQYPVKKGADEPSATNDIPFNLQTYSVDLNKEHVLVGEEMYEGVTAKVVRIVDPSNLELLTTVWIDPAKCVPLKVEKRLSSTSGGSKKDKEKGVEGGFTRILYKDVKQLSDGRWMPFRLEIYKNNILASLKIYKKLAINVGLDDNLFEPMEKFIR